jgi:hypothetical protein
MVNLSEEWCNYLKSQPETGMGYWVVSVTLRDGRVFDRAVIVDGMITQIKDRPNIPFSVDDIAGIRVTHDKWKFNQ